MSDQLQSFQLGFQQVSQALATPSAPSAPSAAPTTDHTHVRTSAVSNETEDGVLVTSQEDSAVQLTRLQSVHDTKVADLTGRLQELQTKYDYLLGELATATSAKEQQAVAHVAEVNRLEAECRQLQSDMAGLEDIVSEQDGELARTVAALNQKNAELSAYKSELEEYKVKLQSLEAQTLDLSASARALEALSERHSTLQAERDQLQLALEESRAEFEARINQLGQKHDCDLALLATEHATLDQELTLLRSQVAALTRELDQARRDQGDKELSAMYEELQQELMKAIESHTDLEQAWRTKEAQYAAQIASQADLEQALRDKEAQYAAQIALQADLEQALRDKEAQYAAQIDMLDTTVQTRVLENISIREEAKAVSAELLSTKDQLQSLLASYTHSRDEYAVKEAQYRASIDQLNQSVNILTEELTHSRQLYQDKCIAYDEINNKFKHLQSLLQQKQQDEVVVTTLQAELSNMRQRAEDAELAIQKYDEKKKRDLEALKQHNELILQLQAEKYDLQADKRELTQERVQLKGLLDIQQQELERLRAEKEDFLAVSFQQSEKALQIAPSSLSSPPTSATGGSDDSGSFVVVGTVSGSHEKMSPQQISALVADLQKEVSRSAHIYNTFFILFLLSILPPSSLCIEPRVARPVARSPVCSHHR